MDSTKSTHSMDGEKGTTHWRWQRISALLLMPLSLWLVLSFGDVIYSQYDQALDWVSAPIVALLLCLTLICLLFHGHLGIVVVIDDYARDPWRKRAIGLSAFISTVIGLLALIAVATLVVRT